ncbi:putative UV damage endonuclease [Rosellinia necatrix]|uniref:Putative UV damage endonuclease n=1 Tax=Rosellinia necatrix TaxID=77044 RepID=A0A1W2TS81_ROSNE|nr:putative UV damage endonuclease [Rosellinia necatrix]
MSPKHRKSGMALIPSDGKIDEYSFPGQMSSGPRRSGRLLHRGSPSADALKDGLRHDVAGEHRTNVALSGLQEMEDQLRDVIKRQKMAIKESEVQCSRIDKAQDALLPRLIKAQSDDMAYATKPREEFGAEGKSAGEMQDFDYTESWDEKNDPESEDMETFNENNTNVQKREGARPPPVNSEYLPLPWKGRLGYACLNTYLRSSSPPVFSSRTCRISSIIEHRHPLRDPSQPEHPTKNRPDKEKPADIERGQKYVEELGLANASDIVKMLRWNHKYGIKFMRLSSEMFPFASHGEYGYKLAPFASDVLANAGKVAGELGHRLTTHPGQFTQLGSPRAEVVENSVRDLEYHNEMLSLLRLPDQQDKDAVMILHMGGVFGDKGATLNRFRDNYNKLSDEIKARLVLENDDVSWTVHDLLPICEELNIPLVLDYHHHNIMFDKDKVREGTKDIMELYPRIKATWDRKGITQKMHYSEPCSEAVTPRQRRKHRPRVMTLPPCADTMDLMIEAKDKEQAVFDLMRIFRLPGWDRFNDVIPYEREDENRSPPKAPKKKQQRKKKAKSEDEPREAVDEPKPQPVVPEEELGMGGPEGRVYWPVGMEEWLHPRKREVKKRKAGDEGAEE